MTIFKVFIVIAILSLYSYGLYDEPIIDSCVWKISDSSIKHIPMETEGNLFAHGGGLNKCGCHFNRKTGECHCHRNKGCGCECEPSSCK